MLHMWFDWRKKRLTTVVFQLLAFHYTSYLQLQLLPSLNRMKIDERGGLQGRGLRKSVGTTPPPLLTLSEPYAPIPPASTSTNMKEDEDAVEKSGVMSWDVLEGWCAFMLHEHGYDQDDPDQSWVTGTLGSASEKKKQEGDPCDGGCGEKDIDGILGVGSRVEPPIRKSSLHRSGSYGRYVRYGRSGGGGGGGGGLKRRVSVWLSR